MKIIQGTQTNTDSGTTVTTNTRRGSIGVITNQDMIEKERKVNVLTSQISWHMT